MADCDSTEGTADALAEQRKARAAYMREYRKRNPDKYKVIDKEHQAKQRAKDPDWFLERAKERQRRYRERKKAAPETPEERERRLEANRRRNAKYAAKPEVKAKKAAKHQDRVAADPEKHKAKGRESAAKWRARHPDKHMNLVHRRRCIVESGDVPAEAWAAILALYGHRCAYCRKDGVKLTIDHVLPLSKGGTHTPDNVVPACMACNCSKNNRLWPRPEPYVADAATT